MPYQCSSAIGSSVKRCPTPQETIRRFLCAGCGVAVCLCTTCDRGQRYCSVGCARSVRRQSQRESDRRYQSSQRGRLNHAERSRRYRQRHRSVTEHSSVVPPKHSVRSTTSDVSMPSSDEKTATTLASVSTTDERGSSQQIKCHFCRRWCAPWVRHAPLRRRISAPRRGSRRGQRGRFVTAADNTRFQIAE
jgi:hypothetical protein